MPNFKPITNVNLDDQLSYAEQLPAGMSYLESNSFMIMGETEGEEEVSLVSCMFRVGGGKDGPWMVDDGSYGQTTFLVNNKNQIDGMQDNDFIGNRSWITDNWSPLKISRTEDAVIWTQGARSHICRPPYWEFKGEHMGMEFDLLLTGIGEAAYHKGPYPKLAESNIAGYEHPFCVEGTVKANGKTYTLQKDKSFGCHEKFTQPAFDLAKVLQAGGYYWAWWANERVRIFIYYYPQMNRTYSHVTVDGQSVPFMENGQTNMQMNELEYWVDPKTRLQVPVKWSFQMSSAAGKVNMDVKAGSRTYYSYLTKSGATMHYGLHSHSNGTLVLADGSSVPLNNMRTYVEHGWTAIPLQSHAD